MIGTLNIGRMGEAEAHFSKDEFELDPALRGPGRHRPPERPRPSRRPRPAARLDALTGLRNHGAFQADLDELLARAGRADVPGLVRGAHARPRRLQERSTTAAATRPETASSAGDRRRAARRASERRTGSTGTAATSSPSLLPGVGADEARRDRRPGGRRDGRGRDRRRTARTVTVSIGVGRVSRPTGRTKDELVMLGPTPSCTWRRPPGARRARLAGLGSARAAAPSTSPPSTRSTLGAHGPPRPERAPGDDRLPGGGAGRDARTATSTSSTEAEGTLQASRSASGRFRGVDGVPGDHPRAGNRRPRLGDRARPMLVEDYDAWAGRPPGPRRRSGRIGSVVGVPLTAGGARSSGSSALPPATRAGSSTRRTWPALAASRSSPRSPWRTPASTPRPGRSWPRATRSEEELRGQHRAAAAPRRGLVRGAA